MDNLEKIKNKMRSGRVLGVDYSHPDYVKLTYKGALKYKGDMNAVEPYQELNETTGKMEDKVRRAVIHSAAAYLLTKEERKALLQFQLERCLPKEKVM
jgi:hypothetical protein